MDNFRQFIATRKTGAEPLHDNGQLLDTNLLAFWQWSASDLVSNALRGRFAEYLVAYALGVTDGIRIEWDAYDLKTTSGRKVEVKSAAYVQSWQQTKFSAITFGIRPTYEWDAETNTYSSEQKRQADVYVFALLVHRDKATIDPLNVAQWQFYVLPVVILNAQLPIQKTVSLATVQRLGATQAQFSELRAVVEDRSAE